MSQDSDLPDVPEEDAPALPVPQLGTTTPFLNPRTYDFLNNMVKLGIPGVASFYFGLSQIWGLPKGEEVVGSLTLLATFIGVVLLMSKVSYKNSDAKYDGIINVTENQYGIKQATMDLANYENPADVVNQKEVVFKVNDQR
jgi:hypothetical protein